MKNVIPIMVCALVFLLPPYASAQDSSVTPEVAAKAFMDATREGDWARCAKLMHPDALKQIRGLFGPIIADLKTEKEKRIIESILGVKDKAEFDKLSDEELWVNFSRAIIEISPDLKKMLNASSFEIIGPVQQSPDLVHIVYRIQLKIEAPELKAPIPFSKLDVMSLRRYGNSWRDLKGDLQAIIQALAAGFSSETKAQETEKTEPSKAKKPASKP